MTSFRRTKNSTVEGSCSGKYSNVYTFERIRGELSRLDSDFLRYWYYRIVIGGSAVGVIFASYKFLLPLYEEGTLGPYTTFFIFLGSLLLVLSVAAKVAFWFWIYSVKDLGLNEEDLPGNSNSNL